MAESYWPSYSTFQRKVRAQTRDVLLEMLNIVMQMPQKNLLISIMKFHLIIQHQN